MPDEKTPAIQTATVPSSVTLERGAMERVLARASELQALGADAPEGLTEAQLLELGKEVGISSEHLRQALAEERTRVAPFPKSTASSDRGTAPPWPAPRA